MPLCAIQTNSMEHIKTNNVQHNNITGSSQKKLDLLEVTRHEVLSLHEFVGTFICHYVPLVDKIHQTINDSKMKDHVINCRKTSKTVSNNQSILIYFLLTSDHRLTQKDILTSFLSISTLYRRSAIAIYLQTFAIFQA